MTFNSLKSVFELATLLVALAGSRRRGMKDLFGRAKERQKSWLLASGATAMMGLLADAILSSVIGRPLVLTDQRPAWDRAVIGSLYQAGAVTASTVQFACRRILHSTGIVLRVGSGWRSWDNNEANVIWTGANRHTVRLYPGAIGALGFEVQPQFRRLERFLIQLSDGSRLIGQVDGTAEPHFFGFVGQSVRWVDITNLDASPFAVGRFVMSFIPAPEKTSAARSWNELIMRRPANSACALIITGGDQYVTVSDDAANLISNRFNVNISGTFGNSYDTGLTLYLGYDQIEYMNGVFVGAGSYDLSFTRTQIPADTYVDTEALWSDPGISSYCEFPDPWYVVGSARHSVYNTPDEASCSSDNPGNSSAWITTYTVGRRNGRTACLGASYQPVSLNTIFMQQTSLNGFGYPIAGGPVLKPLVATSGVSCPAAFPLPPGAVSSSDYMANNVFAAVATVQGACNTSLSNTTVAVRPVINHPLGSDTLTPVAACRDNIFGVTASQSNAFASTTKTIADVCPACTDPIQANGPSIYTHFDNYITETACFPHNNNDLAGSPFWTADVVGESR